MAFPSSYQLYALPDKYVLTSDSHPCLIIDRISEEISLSDSVPSIPKECAPLQVFAIWGVIRLLSGSYLLVVTGRELAGTLLDHSIYRVTSTQVLPFAKSVMHLTEADKVDEKTFVEMLNFILNLPAFYYSLTYDLTHTMQRLHDTGPDFRNLSMFERADDRFVWNRQLLDRFSKQENLRQFCVPIMLGFVQIVTTFVKEERMEYILISRRSTYYAGTRLFARGVDNLGNSANSVETEQIVCIRGNIFSYVQTRGSIPLKWSQKPNLFYKPMPVLIGGLQEQTAQLRRHVESQMYMHRYGRIVLVNLVDQTGGERELGKLFANICNLIASDDVKYESFDFHKECRKMQWHRLSILIDRLMPDMESMGYFHLHEGSSTSRSQQPLPNQQAQLLRRQEGVLRTNCIDCLDRTNVVQSMFAFAILEHQLRRIGVLHVTETLQEALQQQSAPLHRYNPADFYWVFKSVWSDHADYCSMQYTGTPALKTDFTRTGKRTWRGALADGYNSVARYIYNNFCDGFRQDSFDLFLGNYVVSESGSDLGRRSPLRVQRDWKYRYLPIIFYVAFAMFLVSVVVPADTWTEQMMYLLFWGTACVLTGFTIFTFGRDFVDCPKLKPKDPGALPA